MGIADDAKFAPWMMSTAEQTGECVHCCEPSETYECDACKAEMEEAV